MNRNADIRDLLAGVAFLVAKQHEGKVELDCAEMAGNTLRLSARFEERGDQVLLVLESKGD